MRAQACFGLLTLVAAVIPAVAQKGAPAASASTPRSSEGDPPPRVWQDPNYRNPWAASNQTVPAGQIYVYDQRPLGGRAPLVQQEQAQATIDRFKEGYAKLGSPRMLIYVNRELVDEQGGLKLIRREEQTETIRNNGNSAEFPIRSTNANSYRSDGKAAPTLADRQTVRDVERLFGRPLRAAGVTLTDQRVAAQLIADKPIAEFIGSSDSAQARKDREALAKVADAVIEILIASKSMNVPMISGNQTISVPDIQATAISLKDARILGQASSADITGRLAPSSLSQFSVQEIAEATAFELMEDITQSE
ncbi:MAG TPA: hypothetical protein VEH04_08105 [Verrucomicrobiae bacterium]|nr:hypothetical protein [Verrucomicrobiae bacterium]